jgi:hypothetical protein
MKYYYLVIMTPAGPVCMHARTASHPLVPSETIKIQRDIATKLSLQTKVMFQAEQVMIVNVVELPLEAAQELFPQDFGPVIKPTNIQIVP